MVRTLLALSFLLASPLWAADPSVPAVPTPTPIPEPWRGIHRVLGGEADLQEGVLRLSFPRDDLNVLIEGVALAPGMVQSLLYFRTHPKGTQVLGSLVLMEREVAKTAGNLTGLGFEVLGIEAHFLNASPSLRVLQLVGRGPEGKLTANLKRALGTTGVLRPTAAASSIGNLPLAKVEASLGPGRREGGALVYRVLRKDLTASSEEDLPNECSFLFQASGTSVVAGGEWVCGAEEFPEVLRGFQKQGIRVCSLTRMGPAQGKGTCRVRYWFAGEAEEVLPALGKFWEKWTAPGNGEPQGEGAPAFSTPDPVGGP